MARRIAEAAVAAAAAAAAVAVGLQGCAERHSANMALACGELRAEGGEFAFRCPGRSCAADAGACGEVLREALEECKAQAAAKHREETVPPPDSELETLTDAAPPRQRDAAEPHPAADSAAAQPPVAVAAAQEQTAGAAAQAQAAGDPAEPHPAADSAAAQPPVAVAAAQDQTAGAAAQAQAAGDPAEPQAAGDVAEPPADPQMQTAALPDERRHEWAATFSEDAFRFDFPEMSSNAGEYEDLRLCMAVAPLRIAARLAVQRRAGEETPGGLLPIAAAAAVAGLLAAASAKAYRAQRLRRLRRDLRASPSVELAGPAQV